MSVSHHHVERVERSGSGAGMVLGLLAVLLVAVIAFFFLFGGPARFTSPAPAGQTNVNVPAQNQPSAPQINVPRQIDVNVNQAPAQPQAPSGNP